MSLQISVYLTTREDSLPDLRSFTDETGFYKWKSQIRGVACHTEEFNEITPGILREAKKYRILDAFAVIEYPPGQVFEADDNIGEKLRDVFHQQGCRFKWKLTRDESAPPDSFSISLEIVVMKPD